MRRFPLVISVFMKHARLITGESNTGEHGRVFAMKIMDRLNEAINEWREKHNLRLWSLWYAC